MAMTRVELRGHPEIAAVVRAGFPGYRKRMVWLHTWNGSGKGINSYWDGGSRAEYALVDMVTGRRVGLPTNTHPYFDITRAGLAGAEDPAVVVDHRGNVTLKILPPGVALVEAGVMGGKPATASVYVRGEDLTRMLGPGGDGEGEGEGGI